MDYKSSRNNCYLFSEQEIKRQLSDSNLLHHSKNGYVGNPRLVNLVYSRQLNGNQPIGTAGLVRRDSFEKKIDAKKEEYKSSLTMHGISRMFSGSRTENWFWLLILLTGLTLGGVVISQLIKKYFKYEIYTEVVQPVTTQNKFPSFTFCDKPSMEGIYFTLCGYGMENFMSNKTCFEKKVIFEGTKDQNPDDYQWGNGYYDVQECSTWGGKQCANDAHIRSLTRFNNTCMTWNYEGDFFDTYGHVDITFRADKSSQMIVLIHDPKIQEIDVTKRYFLDPNVVYDFKIGKTLLKRLPHPFPTNCTYDKLADIFPGQYTRRNCIESITYMDQLRQCGGIYDYHKNFIPEEFLKKHVKPNQQMKDLYGCLAGLSKEETKDYLDMCPIPCEEYDLPASATTYRRSERMKVVDGNKSVYRIGIQLQSVDSYTLIEEKQLYHAEQILSEVGGLFGLVLGASVISFIELFFYLVLFLIQKFILH